jgi:hypothetical protein
MAGDGREACRRECEEEIKIGEMAGDGKEGVRIEWAVAAYRCGMRDRPQHFG